MKTYLAVAAACLTSNFLITPAQAQQPQRAEIEQLLSKYEQALNSSDVNAAVQLYTEDGVFMAPENPAAVGSKVLREAYAGVFQAIALKLKFQIAETKLLSPEWALLRTTSTGVVKIQANGAEVPGSNQELFLLRRTDAQWKIARYSFSSVLPSAK
jgi:uncharacterized protein (TIGR02246 family)